MKFYDRENELALLAGIQKKSLLAAQMTFVVGRRRIGKQVYLSNHLKMRDVFTYL